MMLQPKKMACRQPTKPMKKILYLLLFIFSTLLATAQDDGPGGGKLRQKMAEFIQLKLGLGKEEGEKFQPVFIEYLKALQRTSREYRDDHLMRQQKLAELRIRYRDQFKPIIGEKRSNDVFIYERDFIETVIEIQKGRRERRAAREKNSELLQN